MFQLKLNGKFQQVDGDDGDMPLLWAIREEAGLTGTKYGCGIGVCGACTVHVDGVAVRSCITPVSAAVDKEITTIEGLSDDGKSHKLQQAWAAENVPQCGYCQSGQIMAAAAFLKINPKPIGIDKSQYKINQINPPIPPSPLSAPSKSFMSNNPTIPRKIPTDNKTIPTILLAFAGSILAMSSERLPPVNHNIVGVLWVIF